MAITEWTPLFLPMLLVGHAIADYPLQGDFLSKAKNRYNPIPGVNAGWALIQHSLIHAGIVAIFTMICFNSPSLALILMSFELFMHYVIDNSKCKGQISFLVDQILHWTCKFIWGTIAVMVVHY